MTPSFKPMLARDVDLGSLRFPVYVQAKLDGIRCSIVNGRALSRTLKEIPNREIFDYLSKPEFEGLDGEIVVGDPTSENAYRRSASFVMSSSKTDEPWAFHVFDLWNAEGGYTERYLRLAEFVGTLGSADRLRRLAPELILTPEGLEEVESIYVEEGFEGVILRDPSAPYKFGRSTARRGPLWKLKRFVDGEAVIFGVEEEMYNGNEARTNALGRTERSTSKDGLVGKGTLGSLWVRDVGTGVEFKIGTGFNAAERADLWHLHLGRGTMRPEGPSRIIGLTVKYKSFPVGVKDRPRFPVFLGFRDMEVDG